MATTITARLANAKHPNGQCVLGGVTWTRAWHTASIADADAVIIAASPLFETDATDVVAEAVSGHFAASTIHLGVLAQGVDIAKSDAAAIEAAVAAQFRTAE